MSVTKAISNNPLHLGTITVYAGSPRNSGCQNRLSDQQPSTYKSGIHSVLDNNFVSVAQASGVWDKYFLYPQYYTA